MKALSRPGRIAVIAGAAVAATAVALLAVAAGNAVAEEPRPGRCTDNVNVREEPDINSRIIDVCKAGQEVQTGERQNGFIRMIDLGGWSAEQYVAVEEPPQESEPTPEGGNEGSHSEGESEKGNAEEDSEKTSEHHDDGNHGHEEHQKSSRPRGLLGR